MTLEEYLKIIRGREKMLNRYPTIRFHNDEVFKTDGVLKHLIKSIIVGRRDTYLESSGRFQCEGDSSRSTYDIYRICRHYIQDVTLEDVLFYLLELYKKNEIMTAFCSNIHKRIWTKGGWYADGPFSSDYEVNPENKEMGLEFAQYKQYYTLRKEAETNDNKGESTGNTTAITARRKSKANRIKR